MNARYVADKMFLYLCESSLILFNQIRTVLNELISDPDSNEELWLIREQNKIMVDCVYHYVGSLKGVVYSLLVQHIRNGASTTMQKNLLNDIDVTFAESEEVLCLSFCLYEERAVENTQMLMSRKSKSTV